MDISMLTQVMDLLGANPKQKLPVKEKTGSGFFVKDLRWVFMYG
jgi:hypothetical protein